MTVFPSFVTCVMTEEVVGMTHRNNNNSRSKLTTTFAFSVEIGPFALYI